LFFLSTRFLDSILVRHPPFGYFLHAGGIFSRGILFSHQLRGWIVGDGQSSCRNLLALPLVAQHLWGMEVIFPSFSRPALVASVNAGRLPTFTIKPLGFSSFPLT